MLLQSQGNNNVIRFLPALPAAAGWRSGRVEGLRARNGFTVSMQWQEGRLLKAKIKSTAGKPVQLLLPQGLSVYNKKGKKVAVPLLKDNLVAFETKKGDGYFIR